MFDHLSYLLENSGIGLGERPRSLDGCPQLRARLGPTWASYRSLSPKQNRTQTWDTEAQTALTPTH